MVKQQVLDSLGAPVKETTESGMMVLWYGYNAPTLADFYYFNNESLAFISKSYYQNPKVFSEYLAQYGTPAQSVRKYASDDSLMQTVHIWPAAGRAVTTVGSDRNSNVVREDTFAPLTLQQYFTSWGVNIAQNQHVTITNELAQIVSSQAVPIAIMSAGGISLIVVAVAVVLFIRKKLKKPAA